MTRAYICDQCGAPHSGQSPVKIDLDVRGDKGSESRYWDFCSLKCAKRFDLEEKQVRITTELGGSE